MSYYSRIRDFSSGAAFARGRAFDFVRAGVAGVMTASSFNQVTSVGNKAEAASIIAAEPSAAKAGVDRDSMLGQR